MFTRALLASAALGAASAGIIDGQICGNYCGPGWCNGEAIPEGKCDDSAKPTSSADSCCKLHDECCGHKEDQSSCNRELVACLSRLSPADMSCTRSGGFIPFDVPVSPVIIEKTIGVVKDWCCGQPCPPESSNEVAAPRLEVGKPLAVEVPEQGAPLQHVSDLAIQEDASQSSLENLEDGQPLRTASSASSWCMVSVLGLAAGAMAMSCKQRSEDAFAYRSRVPRDKRDTDGSEVLK
eukprot:TRINITY_DN28559_c0_g1_i1.p1 TRINITY_DN28559_c0_g1~~TRINITY_DN28559_c0_g1_i1.p1  ORF type:complete len:244 (+),score=48.02 TRINITY_DN28559_c0_g1_i1:22-732(+)